MLVRNIHAWQEFNYTVLREEHTKIYVGLHSLPYHEYIPHNTPVQAILAPLQNRLLWHQHLGHPSGNYLFNAHIT